MRIVLDVLWLWWKHWDRQLAPCALAVTPPQLRLQDEDLVVRADRSVSRTRSRTVSPLT
jgi:hypothetical protein